MKNSYIDLVIENYVKSKSFENLVGVDWIETDRWIELIDCTVQESFLKCGIELPSGMYQKNGSDIFDILKQNESIIVEGDEYTGEWFKFRFGSKNVVVENLLSQNVANDRVQNLGPESLNRALKKIAQEDGLLQLDSNENDNPEDTILDRTAPGSDRIVEFDHNSTVVKKIDEELDQIAEIVRGDNEAKFVPEKEKSRFIEQISATRGLLKVGRVSTRSIYVLAFPLLTYLASKFADEAVGQLAEGLIKALANLIGVPL